MVVYRDSDQKLAVKSSVSSQSSSLRREEAIFQYLGACPDIVKCLGGYSSMENDGSSLYNLVLEYAPGGSLMRVKLAQEVPDQGGKGIQIQNMLHRLRLKKSITLLINCCFYFRSSRG